MFAGFDNHSQNRGFFLSLEILRVSDKSFSTFEVWSPGCFLMIDKYASNPLM